MIISKSLQSSFASLVLVASFLSTPPAAALGTTPACALLPVRSVSVGGDVFLGGDFIELGLSAKGSWGTRGDAPAGFRGNDVDDRVGLGADLDGFCASPGDNVDMPIDFFMPGGEEERWGVSFIEGGTEFYGSFSELTDDASSPGVTGAHAVTNESSGDLLSAKVVSVISVGGVEKLRVTATHSFLKTQAYFTTNVVLENLSGSELTDVRYHRSFDPDNAQFQNGDFDTTNTILGQYGTDGKSVVQAKLNPSDLSNLAASGQILERLSAVSSIVTEIPIVFFSSDADSVVYFGGFDNANPYSPAGAGLGDPFDSPQSTGDFDTDDIAIGVILRRPNLAIDAQTTPMRFVTSLDARDFSELATELVAASQGESGAADPVASDPVASEPHTPRLVLPRVDSYSVRPSSANVPLLRFEGVRFWCISSVQIDGTSFQFKAGYNFEGNEFITLEIPQLAPGTKELVFESCMGRMSFHNWLIVPSPNSSATVTTGVKTESPSASMWHKSEVFGLDDALRSKILSFTQTLGSDYSKVRCIVNSRNGVERNEAFAAEICAYAKSSTSRLNLESTLESRGTFDGNGYWVNIWASSGRD